MEIWTSEEVVEEVKQQVMFSLPMILTNVAFYSIPLISVMFAGHLGDLELAGATLANSWATVTGYTLMVWSLSLPPFPSLSCYILDSYGCFILRTSHFVYPDNGSFRSILSLSLSQLQLYPIRIFFLLFYTEPEFSSFITIIICVWFSLSIYLSIL